MISEFKTKDDIRRWWLKRAKAEPSTVFHLHNAWGEPTSEQKAQLFEDLKDVGYLEQVIPSRDTRYILTEQGKDFVKTAQS